MFAEVALKGAHRAITIAQCGATPKFYAKQRFIIPRRRAQHGDTPVPPQSFFFFTHEAAEQNHGKALCSNIVYCYDSKRGARARIDEVKMRLSLKPL